MKWNYAELSKMAKESGGPEKLVDVLIASGKKEILPWLGIAFVSGAAFAVFIPKAIQYFSKKIKHIPSAEEDAAKQELIEGIKDYDHSQTISAEELQENNDNKDEESENNK